MCIRDSIKYQHSDGTVATGYGEGFIIGGTESNGCVVRVDGGIKMPDLGSAGGNGARLYCGTANDFSIWHDGSISSYVSGITDGHDLYVRCKRDLYLQSGDNSSGYQNSIYMDNNGGVQLYYDNNMRAKTISDGFQVHGDEGLQIYARTNSPSYGARIEFSDHLNGSYAQQGQIYYKHSDNSVLGGYSDCFVLEGNEANTGFKVDADIHTKNIYPLTDNDKDFGSSSKRWRHVYTSAGIRVGGTGDANTLDDYEEGYHDTTITVGSGSINTYHNRRLRYSKIGRQVTVWGRLYWTASTSGNMSSFKFSLPFTSNSSTEYETSNNFQAIRATSYNQQEGFRTFRVRSGVSECVMEDNNGGNHGHFGTSTPHLNVFLCYSV